MTKKVFISSDHKLDYIGEPIKYTNYLLLRIGRKPAISYIIENYPKTTEFIIGNGEFIDHIKQFLKLAYPDRIFKFVNYGEEKALTKGEVIHKGYNIPPRFDLSKKGELTKARKNIQDKFDILDKDNESIFFVNDSVIKFFYDDNIVKNRVSRSRILGKITPNVEKKYKNFYRYPYTQGDLYADVVTPEDFTGFLLWAKKNLWKKTSETKQNNFKKVCNDFYYKKTFDRFNKFLTKHNLKDKKHIINGEKVPSVKEIFEKLDLDWLTNAKQAKFHGDFILDNIIKTKDGYMLLDWRQDFGGLTKAGDMYYDLAKLNHNLSVNHDIIYKDKFNVNIHGNKVSCDIKRKRALKNCQNILFDFIEREGYDAKKVKALTGIIWLNMAPLHHEPFDQFLYYWGKLNLWQAIK